MQLTYRISDKHEQRREKAGYGKVRAEREHSLVLFFAYVETKEEKKEKEVFGVRSPMLDCGFEKEKEKEKEKKKTSCHLTSRSH